MPTLFGSPKTKNQMSYAPRDPASDTTPHPVQLAIPEGDWQFLSMQLGLRRGAVKHVATRILTAITQRIRHEYPNADPSNAERVEQLVNTLISRI